MNTSASSITSAQVGEWLAEISDPEIPVLSIVDLGILRGFNYDATTHTATVQITPTYSGCPAMDLISMQVRMALMSRGIQQVTVDMVLSPAWTTDWITESGKEKMKNYGIAPPQRRSADKDLGLFERDEVPCPRCGSVHTALVNQFGATSCKSMYKCLDCKEPFEHFKCH
jgi:ring-1,2-phenylacetyl-CoA epoxidase subunit PaaD